MLKDANAKCRQAYPSIQAFYALAKIALLVAAVTLTFTSAQARESDLSKPIDVRADSSEFDEKAGIQTLSGNVVITQGTMEISADFIAISLTNNALSKIEGRGSPIRFSQENEAGERMQGEAQQIIYDALNGILILKGNASLSQPRQSLTSEQITFNARTQKVSAEGGAQDGRVSIQIQPPGSGQ